MFLIIFEIVLSLCGAITAKDMRNEQKLIDPQYCNFNIMQSLLYGYYTPQSQNFNISLLYDFLTLFPHYFKTLSAIHLDIFLIGNPN